MAVWLPTVEQDILTVGADIIVQQVNCMGVMGAGLALQIKRKYPWVERQYKEVCQHYQYRDRGSMLGLVQFCSNAEHEPIVANFFAQVRYGRGIRQTDYAAFSRCVQNLAIHLNNLGRDLLVAIPYGIGCGLAGGDWGTISTILARGLENTSCKFQLCRYTG